MKKKDSSTGNTNTYQKEQAKHLKRIRSFLKDAKNRGYIFYDRKVPKSLVFRTDVSEYTAPKTVKEPTAVTVNRLSKITPDYLYERALFVDPVTGEVMSGVEGRKLEDKRRGQKAAQTRKKNKVESERPPDVIQPPPTQQPYWVEINQVRQYIQLLQNCTTGWPQMDEYKRERGRYLTGYLEDHIEAADMEGRLYEYSEHLKASAQAISNIVDATLPESDREVVNANVGEIMEIIHEHPLTNAEWAGYNDAMEYGSYSDEGQ